MTQASTQPATRFFTRANGKDCPSEGCPSVSPFASLLTNVPSIIKESIMTVKTAKETNSQKQMRILSENKAGSAKKAKSSKTVKSSKAVKSAKKGKASVSKSSAKKVITRKAAKPAVKKVAEVKIVSTPKAKTPAKKIVRANRQIVTRSTHGKLQQRTTGSRVKKNSWGHFEGTIGAKIDVMISHENFTKKQIQAMAGTKMSKVNSHINHLRKEKGFPVTINTKTKVVSFG